MTEYIPDGFLRVLWQILRYLLIDLCIDMLIHGYGYLTLKIFSLGRYPKLYGTERNVAILAGIVAMLVTVALILYWHNAG